MKRYPTQWLVPWLLALLMAFTAQSIQARELPDFTELVDQAAPGVVNISTSRMVKTPAMRFHGQGDSEIPEIFRHFFGDQFGDQFGMPPGQGGEQAPEQERQSLGSGFVISDDGYIMTNAHVVEGADEILVLLSDRRELEAKLIGADTKTDVALLKVDAKDLPILNLGNSDDLKVGEWVAAIGSPFGFDHSVTAGIVSAINRTLPTDAYVPFIQTDVAINPGNSGGPLFNLDGEVVGINSQIFTRSGGFMGLSFAIPISVAMNVADQLRDEGHVTRGWLGVVIQPVSRELAKSFGLDKPQGALVADLDPEGPAARDGLQAGDIIMKVGGENVDRSTTLPRLVGNVSPDTKVELTIRRDGKEMTKTVKVGSWPDMASDPKAQAPAQDSKTRLGLGIGELDQATRDQLGIDGGVRVEQVEAQSAAAKAGIRRGDVIVSLGNKPVDSPDALVDIVKSLDKQAVVPVRLYRGGNSLFVALELEDDNQK